MGVEPGRSMAFGRMAGIGAKASSGAVGEARLTTSGLIGF